MLHITQAQLTKRQHIITSPFTRLILTAQTDVFPKARNADAMCTMKTNCKLWNNAKDLTREKSKEILNDIIIKINIQYPKKRETLTKNFYVHGQLA